MDYTDIHLGRFFFSRLFRLSTNFACIYAISVIKAYHNLSLHLLESFLFFFRRFSCF